MATLEQTQNTDVSQTENTGRSPLHPVPYLRAIPGLQNNSDWPQLLESLLNEFKPDSPTFEQHVHRTAEAELVLRREQTRFDCWYGSQSEPETWDSKVEKKYRDMRSRVDSAQRTYTQWFKLIDSTRRNRLLDRARLDRAARLKAKDEPPERRGVWPGPKDNTLPFIQIIQLRRVDGKFETSMCPDNEVILGAVRKPDHPRITVRRRFCMRQDMPAEYDWVRYEDGSIPSELNWTLTKEEFEADAEAEQADDRGLVLPSKNALAGERTPVREVVLK